MGCAALVVPVVASATAGAAQAATSRFAGARLAAPAHSTLQNLHLPGHAQSALRGAHRVAGHAAFPRLAATHVFHVNSSADLGTPGIPVSPVCVATNGKCTLRAALDVASVLNLPATIILPPGTFTVTSPLFAFDINGVTIQGASTAKTIISGGASTTVFAIVQPSFGNPAWSTAGSVVAVKNLTVAHGTASAGAPFSGAGGCFYVKDMNDALSLSGVRLTDCKASAGAGGVFSAGTFMATNTRFDGNVGTGGGGAIEEIFGSLTLDHDTFANNTTTGAGGAVLAVLSSVSVTNSSFSHDSALGSGAAAGSFLTELSNASFVNDTFSHETATSTVTTNDSSGGSMLLVAGTTVIDRCTFTANGVYNGQEDGGGAILAAGQTKVLNSKFTGNVVSGNTKALGGAIQVPTGSASSLQVIGSTFANNAAQGPSGISQGGALDIESGTLDVSASTFTANHSSIGHGGAVSVASGLPSTFSVDTFKGNVAPGYGGALVLFEQTATTLTDVTMTGNHGNLWGGALLNAGVTTAHRLTVSGNFGTAGAGLFNSGPFSGDQVVVTGNKGSVGGGILHADVVPWGGHLVTLHLTNSVIAGNVAGTAAGVYDDSATGGGLFTNVRVEQNRTPGGVEADCDIQGSPPQPISTAGGNTIGDHSCNLRAASDRQGVADQGYWFGGATGAVSPVKASNFGHAGGPLGSLASAPGGLGYWELATSGAVHAFGAAAKLPGAVGKLGGGTATVIAPTLSGMGYWIGSSTGTIAAIGDAKSFGQPTGQHIVDIAPSPDAKGYEVLLASGKVMAFGDAKHLGSKSMAAAGLAMTPSGLGYFEVSETGAVVGYGDAKFKGSVSTSGVIGIASSPTGKGYLIFTSAGKVYAKGDAHSSGSKHGTFVAVDAS